MTSGWTSTACRRPARGVRLVDRREGVLTRRRLRANTGVALNRAEYVQYFARRKARAVQVNGSKGFSEARLWRLERRLAS